MSEKNQTTEISGKKSRRNSSAGALPTPQMSVRRTSSAPILFLPVAESADEDKEAKEYHVEENEDHQRDLKIMRESIKVLTDKRNQKDTSQVRVLIFNNDNR